MSEREALLPTKWIFATNAPSIKVSKCAGPPDHLPFWLTELNFTYNLIWNILTNLTPKPDPKSPARHTTLIQLFLWTTCTLVLYFPTEAHDVLNKLCQVVHGFIEKK